MSKLIPAPTETEVSTATGPLSAHFSSRLSFFCGSQGSGRLLAAVCDRQRDRLVLIVCLFESAPDSEPFVEANGQIGLWASRAASGLPTTPTWLAFPYRIPGSETSISC